MQSSVLSLHVALLTIVLLEGDLTAHGGIAVLGSMASSALLLMR